MVQRLEKYYTLHNAYIHKSYLAGCPGVAEIGALVSDISCFGDSSIHITGYLGSYGRLYTSSTISMLATKLPFSFGGITQPFRCQGLISFFLIYDVLIRGKCCQCIQALLPCLLIIATTILQNLLVARYNLTRLVYRFINTSTINFLKAQTCAIDAPRVFR